MIMAMILGTPNLISKESTGVDGLWRLATLLTASTSGQVLLSPESSSRVPAPTKTSGVAI